MESIKKMCQLPVKRSIPDIYSKLLVLFEVSDQPAQSFKSAFGVSPMQFVSEEKMRRARYLLQNTTESICKISESLGFSTPGYFSKVFRQVVGIPPTE